MKSILGTGFFVLLSVIVGGGPIDLAVDFSRPEGTWDMPRFALGQRGLQSDSMLAPHVKELKVLRPRTIRLFLDRYYRIYTDHGRYDFARLDPELRAVRALGRGRSSPSRSSRRRSIPRWTRRSFIPSITASGRNSARPWRGTAEIRISRSPRGRWPRWWFGWPARGLDRRSRIEYNRLRIVADHRGGFASLMSDHPVSLRHAPANKNHEFAGVTIPTTTWSWPH